MKIFILINKYEYKKYNYLYIYIYTVYIYNKYLKYIYTNIYLNVQICILNIKKIKL